MTPTTETRASRRFLRSILRLPVYLYRAHLGFLLGHRFLLLRHRGRRSGRSYDTVLEVLHYDPVSDESIVMAAWGPSSGWMRNLEAGTAELVCTGRHRYTPVHRRLEHAEAASVLAGYERRHRALAPVVRIVLSRFLGWPYDGTIDARRRVVDQLPLVAFRPRDPHALAGGQYLRSARWPEAGIPRRLGRCGSPARVVSPMCVTAEPGRGGPSE
jgi:deazaflavin-dependent oxidoreductase (nitroreductase family)